MNEQRTLQQNKALHKLFRQLSEQLNDAGLDMKAVLKPDVDIAWTPEMVKEYLWRPIFEVMTQKESTADANTTDYSAVYDVLSRHLGQKLGITPPPFPSEYSQSQEFAENLYRGKDEH